MTNRPLEPYDMASQDVVAIYQMHLDVTSRLVFERASRSFCDHIVLPYVFRTGAGESVAETEDELIRDIDNIGEWLHSNKVTDYYRIARSAQMIDAKTIEGVHITYVLRGALSVIEPYANRMILRLIEGHWRASQSEHELAGALFPSHDARPRPGLFSGEWADQSGVGIPDAARALEAYQGFLTQLDACVSEIDFDQWCTLNELPVSVHYDAKDYFVADFETSRPLFNAMVDRIADTNGNTMQRLASRAEHIAADKIVGYHDCIILKGDTVVFGPVKSRMVIVLRDGAWRCKSVTNSLKTEAMPGKDFCIADTLPTMREIQERMRK